MRTLRGLYQNAGELNSVICCRQAPYLLFCQAVKKRPVVNYLLNNFFSDVTNAGLNFGHS